MKNYLIIGGSSGIGLELAKQLTNNGDRVFSTYNETQPSFHEGEISHHALNVLDTTLDLSFVSDELNGIIYCPGSINLKPFHRIKPDAFTEDFQLQVVGAIKVIQALIPNLKAAARSSIVFFSTVAVQQGFPFHTQVAVSKGAIEGLTKALAADYAPAIRVNCIAPSLTDTPLAERLLNTEEKKEANAQRHPLKKIGDPAEIAGIAKFLLSEQADWMTGQIIHADGGMSSLRI